MSRVPSSLLAFVVVPVLVSCATTGSNDTSFVAVQNEWQEPPGDAPARMLHDEQRVRFEQTPEGPVAYFVEKRQIQVWTPAGQHYTELFSGYSSTFQSVVHYGARLLDPSGKELKTWAQKDAIDAPAFADWTLYQDTRSIGVDVPDQPPGSIVEMVFVTRMTSPQLFAAGHTFGHEIPVERSRLVVDVPAGMEIEHVADVDGAATESKPVIEELKDGARRYTWERRGIAALVAEPYGPSPGALAETVSLRLKSWTDAQGVVQHGPADAAALSRFTYDLQHERAVVTPEIEARVKELLQGVPDDPRAKARRLYAWTRDSIRYCAIAVGMGGWVPHASNDVEKLRYGDCKDKANLLKAMLKVAGIESRLVTIYHDSYPNPFRLPVLAGNFNHAILLVDLPAGPVWVDPTTRTTPFDDLPPGDEDRMALPISAKGDVLVPTLPSDPARERIATTAKLTLETSGKAKGSFALECNGAFADRLRDNLLSTPAGRHGDAIAQALPFDDAKVLKFSVDNAAPPEEVTPAHTKGDVETVVTSSLRPNSDVVFSARSLLEGAVPVIKRDRKAPVVFGFRQTREQSIDVALPVGAAVTRLPDPVTIETEHLKYTLTWTKREPEGTAAPEGTGGAAAAGAAGVTLTRALLYKVRHVPLAEMKAYADASERIAAAEEQKVVVKVGG